MSLDKLDNIKHEPNIIELQLWHSIHDTIMAPMITALCAKDIPESDLAIGFAYITKPETLGGFFTLAFSQTRHRRVRGTD
jgi:hypothetical protein